MNKELIERLRDRYMDTKQMLPCQLEHEAADRIEELEKQRDELLACLYLLYSWANNWDSEFMNDQDWKNKDYPRIQSAVATVKGQQ